jgi:uncharacterized RDD family membrane protein YckC
MSPQGMSPADVANLPSLVPIFVPAVGGVAVGVLLTSVLLFAASRFDPTQGVLTLSIMITLGMLGATAYCLLFTIPNDDITPGVVGALSAGFGAVVAHWLGRVSTTTTPPQHPSDDDAPP